MSLRTSTASRRAFLSGAAAASAYFWIPKSVNGYSTAEMLAMTTVDNKVKPGISKWELDTPALCVDLDKMERNIANVLSAAVSVKASTNEGMGWIGRGEGIGCVAVALVELD